MNGPTHIGFGAAAGLVFLPMVAAHHGQVMPLPTVLGLSVITARLAKTPDYDQKLRIWRWQILKHRGFTHSLAFLALCWWLGRYGETHWDWAWQVRWVLLLGIGVGGVAPDCLTDRGCPLLWPYKRRFNIATISTGKGVEMFVRALLWGGIAGWVTAYVIVFPLLALFAPYVA